MDKQALRDNLETIISSIQEISLVYLFGSQVGGKVGPMSDYDLGVVVDDGVDENHVFAVLAHELQKKLEWAQIDIVPLKRAPVELFYAIISQGVRVYQRDVVTRVEFEARIMSLYGDYLCVLGAKGKISCEEEEMTAEFSGIERRLDELNERLARLNVLRD